MGNHFMEFLELVGQLGGIVRKKVEFNLEFLGQILTSSYLLEFYRNRQTRNCQFFYDKFKFFKMPFLFLLIKNIVAVHKSWLFSYNSKFPVFSMMSSESIYFPL